MKNPFSIFGKYGDNTLGDEDTYIYSKDIWFDGKGFRLDT